MTPFENQDERCQKILQWLYQRQSISVAELTERLSISRMTIHRDLDFLVEQGAVHKRHGWAQLAIDPPDESPMAVRCGHCRAFVPHRTHWVMQLRNGDTQTACCPHCGLLLYGRHRDLVSAVQTREFLYGRMISALHATYVVGSQVQLCCVPSVLAFVSRSEAERFKRGFGGKVRSFGESLTWLQGQHSVPDLPSRSHKAAD